MFEQINQKENFFVAERKKKINILMGTIARAKAEDKVLSINKLVAEFCIQWGTGKPKVMEYIKLLEDTGRIKIEGDVITWN